MEMACGFMVDGLFDGQRGATAIGGSLTGDHELPLEQIDRPPIGAPAKILCHYYREISPFTVSDQLSISDIYFSWTMSRLPCRVCDFVDAHGAKQLRAPLHVLVFRGSRQPHDWRFRRADSCRYHALISIPTGEDRHGPKS